jgi:transposase
MKKGGVLEFFAGIVVSDRYQGYWSETWTAFARHQACAAHLIRDFEDCAETYPGPGWPQQAQRALRGLIRAWHAAREQGLPPSRQRSASPLSWSSAAPSRSACPRCPASPARRPP